MAQSMESSVTIWPRRCSSGERRGWTVKPSGRLSWVSTTRLTVSSVMADGVSSCDHGTTSSGAGLTTAPGSRGFLPASRVSVKARSSCSW